MKETLKSGEILTKFEKAVDNSRATIEFEADSMTYIEY